MSASNTDPHEKMRARDVNRVARGEQALRPAQEPGTVSRAPPPSAFHRDPAEPKPRDSKTAPAHTRIPSDKQTRHCYPSYLEYIKCIEEKGEDIPERENFAEHCRSLCPSEWIERWNKQRAQGTFPSPI